MRILFVEGYPLHNDTWYIQPFRALLETAAAYGSVCAVYGSDKHLYKSKKYPAPVLTGPFYREKEAGRTWEEDLYENKYIRRGFLQKDIQALNRAIDEFRPELIIDAGRTTASVCARVHRIPYRTIITGAMYRKHAVRPQYLQDLNRVLSGNGLEQILSLKDLNEYAEKRFVFGPLSADPLPEEIDAVRIGGSFLHDTVEADQNGIAVLLPSSAIGAGKLHRLIQDTFYGAPYPVFAHLSQDYPSAGNVDYSPTMKMNTLKERNIVIHDGNRMIYYECLTRGIPQIVISDGSWCRGWIASCALRNCAGLQIEESELSVASLYETYRRLLSDDYYSRRAEYIKKETASLDRFSSILF